MIKKQILMLIAIMLISTSAFSQKAELKAADKAVKKQDYATALSVLNQAEGLIANADAKSKAKYYYLKGMALYADGTKPENIDGVAEAFNQLLTVEEESGNATYSTSAGKILTELIQKIAEDAQKEFTSANAMKDSETYLRAAKGYERVYLLSPTDTSFLYNSALVSALGKGYEKSNRQYQQLLDLGYTGVYTVYKATNIVNGEPKYYNSKSEMDKEVKIGISENSSVETTDSKVSAMHKAMASNYSALEETDKALEAIGKAREINPKDYYLIIDEANIYFKKGDNITYKEKLEEAISINPSDPVLYFNVGVMNTEQGKFEEARKSYEVAIEKDPNYGDAYNAIGNLILQDLEKVQKELDANAANFTAYDRIKEEKWIPILQEALPFIEKSYEINNDDIVMKQLNSLYENLGMDKRVN